jgi:hypothetical protein
VLRFTKYTNNTKEHKTGVFVQSIRGLNPNPDGVASNLFGVRRQSEAVTALWMSDKLQFVAAD